MHHSRIHTHNQHQNQLATKTILDSHKRRVEMTVKELLRTHMMPEVLMMLNTSTNSRPEMTTVDMHRLRTNTHNHLMNQLVTRTILDYHKRRVKMTLKEVLTQRKFQIMLEILIMLNSSINLKPEMITMPTQRLTTITHNQHLSQLAMV